MTSLEEAVARLRKSGSIVSGDSPLAVHAWDRVPVRTWDRAESANLLEQALARSFRVNRKVLESYPPFTHGREEPLVIRRPDGKVLRRRQRTK